MLTRFSPRLLLRITHSSTRATSSLKDGSVARSREFGKKEKAHEDEYVRKHQEEQLRKLREQLEAANAEVARLKKEVEKPKP